MSRYDRQRERKRLMIVAAVVVVFGVAMFGWASHVNGGISSSDQITTQGGQD